jgi:peptidyl-prolyl cis-trans isomerase A (cyclophilin A)
MKFPPIAVPGAGVLHAKLATSFGTIVVRLEQNHAPQAVANFVGLALGTIDHKDPKTGQSLKGTPFYDGLLFHRVVRNFVIQCGDPKTRYLELADEWGTGGPGYKFADEFHEKLRHNRAGVLSMANSGPNTNGSQWFITEVPTPHLDGRHSAFGLVVTGLDVVKKIANAPTESHRPTQDIRLERVTVYRAG